MSGLCGIVDFYETPSADVLHTMLFMIRHRGCGDPHVWTNPHIALGHWDLQTLEPNHRGEQPWWDRPSGTVVAADARLDNRDDIRSGLGLAEATDPELIACGYRRWGQNLFPRIVGDFAIAVWDAQKQTLLLARDPIGVKPLYYCSNGTRLLFASEAKAILGVPGVPRKPDPIRLEEMRRRRYRRRENTFFQDIRRVWPGECLRFGRSEIERVGLWSPDLRGRIRRPTSVDYQREFRALFFEAVRCRLPRQDPVALALSGGMDSSSIACVADEIRRRERTPLNLHTFTFQSSRDPDSLESSCEVSAHTGFQHTRIEVDPVDLLHELENRVFEQETPSPVYDTNYYQALFRAAAAGGARVLLSGLGGDELMQSRAYLADLLLDGKWARLAQELAGIRAHYGTLTTNFLKYALWYLLLPRRQTPRFRKKSAMEVYEGILEPSKLMFMEQLNLQAAHCGLEIRFPFLDVRLVRFVWSIPGEERVLRGEQKRLLREGLADLLPAAVRSRPKRLGFLLHTAAALSRSGLAGGSVEDQVAMYEKKALQAWSDTWFRAADRAAD